MEKDYIVTKSNYFIMNSNYDLSLQEQKIILTLASLVRKDDEEFKPYKFKIAEFMELVGVEDKSKYSEIPKITKELMKKVLEIHEGNTLLQVAWLNSARYEKGSGMVTLKFSPDLKPYMLQLKEQFTQYQLANILTMRSKYSPRIYEILKCNEFKKQGYIELELEELRKLLRTEGMYHQYQDFKRKIIMHTQKELNKKTDISFDFEEIKTGRKVTALRFYIHSNTAKEIKQTLIKIPTNAADEVAAALEPAENSSIQKIMTIMKEHEITIFEAKKIYDSSQGNIELIYKVYQDKKNTQITGGIVGLMISLVKPGAYIEPKKTQSKGGFNDYEQRDYNFDELEKKLLGWENEDNGENYDQRKFNI